MFALVLVELGISVVFESSLLELFVIVVELTVDVAVVGGGVLAVFVDILIGDNDDVGGGGDDVGGGDAAVVVVAAVGGGDDVGGGDAAVVVVVAAVGVVAVVAVVVAAVVLLPEILALLLKIKTNKDKDNSRQLKE